MGYMCPSASQRVAWPEMSLLSNSGCVAVTGDDDGGGRGRGRDCEA